MRLVTIAAFAVFLTTALTAQDRSLVPKQLLELQKAKRDSDRIYLMNQLCFNYSNENTDSGIYFGERAYELAVKTKDERGIADSYNNRGWCYYRRSDYTKAEEFFLEALKRFEKAGRKEFLSVPYSNLGWLHFTQSHYPEAIKYFSASLNAAEQSGDSSSMATTLYSIGAVYNKQNNSPEARKYFTQALEIEKQLKHRMKEAMCYSGIGNSYTNEKNFDKAIEYLEKALTIYTLNNDQYNIGFVNENIGDSYKAKNDYTSALKHYNIAKEKYQQYGGKEDLEYVDMLIGGTLAAAGKPADALTVYREGLSVAEEMNALDDQQQYHQLLSESYESLNDYRNAYEEYRESIALRDTIYSIEKKNELLRVQTEFETERKEKENQLLKAQNDITLARLQRNRVVMIGFAVLALLLATMIWIIYKNRQAKILNIKMLEELNRQLTHQKEEITRMNTVLELKALRAQMNPHFIFNCMSSIQECMLTGRLEDANTYLSKLSKLLRMVLNHSDDESVSLEEELEMLKLYLELESVRLKDGFHYEISVDEEIFPEEIKVPTLILQPFAENAIWHGLLNKPSDRRLFIHVKLKHDVLHCIVQDNGIGREKAAALNSLRNRHPSKGIDLIRKRLEILREKTRQLKTGFVISDVFDESRKPSGTMVDIVLPFQS